MKTSKYKYKSSKSLNNSKDTDKRIVPNIYFSQEKADCTDVADSIGCKATCGIVSRDEKKINLYERRLL